MHSMNVPLLLIKRYTLYKILACSTAFFQLSLFCAIFFQLCTFIFLISSRTSFSQRVLGLPIGLLNMGFHLLTFCTVLSSAMRSTWPNQFNECTSTVFCIWPDDGSKKPKHVAEFLILITNIYCCVID